MQQQEPRDTLTVNGAPRPWRPGLTVGGLLAFLALDPSAVVVEHNGAILPRESAGEAPLAAGDVLEIIHFVGGG